MLDTEEVSTLNGYAYPTVTGTCSGKDIIAMRDKGFTCVILNRNLVTESQSLQKSRHCKYIDSFEHILEVASVKID